MKIIKREQLRPGMKVGSTVYSSSGQVLIARGMSLNTTWIERLCDQGVDVVEIEDGLLDSINVIPNAILEKEALEIRRYFNEVLELFVRQGHINLTPVRKVVEELLGQVLLRRSVLSCMYLYKTSGGHLYEQAVNVSILTLLMGVHLKFDRAQLIDLGIGALLYDLGMLLINEDIPNKSEVLTSEEWEQLKEHSDSGFKILKGLNDVATLSKHVSLHHHERWNGSGYPNGLQGHEIQEYARIVAVADVFAALTADRPYRTAYTFDEALEFITTMSGYYFEPKVVEAFIASIVVYPVGSMVLLNTGEIGRVIGINAQVPTRPTVQMIIRSTAANTRYDDLIDIYKYPELTIVRSLNEQERTAVENKIQV